MNVSTITSNSGSAATAAGTNSSSASNSTTDTYANPSSTLNQSDFLQLLVAQIQYQDPMNPQSDTEMASQLAQFTSLQQASQSSSSLAMIQASSLVGNTVTIQIDSTNTTSGVVTGVVMNSGTPQITVGGTNYNLSQVTSITPPVSSTASNTTPASTATTSNTNN